jgi:hypothetical protein
MYSSIVSEMNDLSLVEIVTANMLKVDTLTYSEIVYNPITKTHEHVTNKMKESSAGYYRLRVLGARILHRSTNNFENILANYKIDIQNDSEGSPVYVFNLNSGKKLYYHFHTGMNFSKDLENKEPVLFDDDYVKKIPLNIEAANVKDFSEFSDFFQIAKMFDEILEQSLLSENMRPLDLFKEYTPDAYLKNMMFLLGNYVGLMHINTQVQSQLMEQIEEGQFDNKVQNLSAVSAGYALDELYNALIHINSPLANAVSNGDISIWSARNRYYNMDLGGYNIDTKNAMQEYADALNVINRQSIKAVTKNSLGKMLPVYAITNSINNSKISFQNIANSNNSILRNNIFAKHPDLLKGIEIRSTIKNEFGEVYHPSKLNNLELLKTTIISEFLTNYLNDNKTTISFQPTNFADKSRHSSLLIDKQGRINTVRGEVKTWKTLTINDLQDLLFESQSTYYRDLSEVLFSDYAKIFNIAEGGESPVSKNYLKNSKVLKHFIKEATDAGYTWSLAIQNPKDYVELSKFAGPTLNKEFKIYNEIKNFSLKPAGNKFNVFNNENLFNKLDLMLNKLNEDTITDSFNDLKTEWYTNIYFEKNMDGKVALNRTFKYYLFNYFNPKNKQKTVSKIEKDFAKKLEEEGFEMDLYDSDWLESNLAALAIVEFPGLDKFKDVDRGVILNYKDGELNPMLKKYLWQHALVSREFQLSTVGSPIGHPFKGKVPSFIKSDDQDAVDDYIISVRLVAQNKRMVKHQATFHPYMQNMINGIARMQNRLYVKDPSVEIYTPNGEFSKVDVADGSSIATLLEINLMNNSLLDQSVGITHKSIGSSLDVRTGAAGLTKHALHGITNSDIQNSPTYKQLMSKLLGVRFTQIEGIELQLDITKDFNGNNINVISEIGNIHFEYKSDTHNISAEIRDGSLVEFKNISNVGPDTYQLTYSVNGKDYLVTKNIDNLYTLWTAFGAEYSLTYKKEEEGKWKSEKDLTNGFVKSNTSWDALTVYTNKVGFYNTTFKHDLKQTLNDKLKTGNVKSLRANLVKRFPNVKFSDKSPDLMTITQSNIIQPLKINNIGQVTFASGQKVGAKNTISLDKLKTSRPQDLNISLEDTTLYGIQLNADHEVDESTVTEPTQIISTASFSGNVTELLDNVYSGIANYILGNMSKYQFVVPLENMDLEDKNKLNDFMKRIVKVAFANQNLSGFSNLIISTINEEKDTGIRSNFKIPASSGQFNTMINTTVANMLTDEGVKRMFPGVAAVAKPYSTFISFKTINRNGKKTVVTKSWYDKFMKGKNIPLQPISLDEFGINTISLLDTVVDPTGKEITINNPLTYYEVKQRIKKDMLKDVPVSWYKKEDADHDLKPPRHEIVLENTEGVLNEYDLPSVMFKYLAEEYAKLNGMLGVMQEEIYLRDGLITRKSDGSSELISDFELQSIYKIPFTTEDYKDAVFKDLSVRINNLGIKLKNIYKIVGYNSKYIRGIDILLDDFSKAKYVNGNLKYEEFNTQELKYIKNWNTELMIQLREKKISNISVTQIPDDIEIDDSQIESYKDRVETIKSLPGQAAMAFPFRSLFGLGEDQDVADVTEDQFFKDFQNKSVPKQDVGYDLFLRDKNGDHAYILIKNSRSYFNFMNKQKFDPRPLETIEEDGISYTVDMYGNKGAIVPNSGELIVNYGPTRLKYYVVDSNQQAINNLFRIVTNDQVKSRFSDAVIRLESDRNNIPFYLEAAKSKLNVGLSQNRLIGLEKEYTDFINKRYKTKDFKLSMIQVHDLEWISLEKEDIETLLKKTAEEKGDVKKLVKYLELLNDYWAEFSNAEDPTRAYDILQEMKSMDLDQNNLDVRSLRHLESLTDVKKIDGSFASYLRDIDRMTFRNLSRTNRTLAKRKFVSFQKALNLIGARIPGQDLQSYMGMEIVHFLSGQANSMYVSPWHQAYTGEDFDIDKVFDLFYSVGRDGFMESWTDLWNDYSKTNLDLSFTLPLADGKERNVIAVTSEDLLTFRDEELDFLNDPLFSKYQLNFKNISKDEDYFRKSVNIINKVRNLEDVYISASQTSIGENLKNLINKYHNHTNTKKGNGYLNAILEGLYNNGLDIRNMNSAHEIMSFGELSDLAKTSKKGEMMAKGSPENPVDIIRAQTANMIGKDAIGINATALKGWSIITNSLLKIRDGKAVGFKQVLLPLLELQGNHLDPIKNFKMIPNLGFKGLNLGKNVEKLAEWLNQNRDTSNSISVEMLLDYHYQRDSTSFQLSALLSAATDNAKELILGRINAYPDTLGYYTSMMLLGMDLKTIYGIMTSDMFESALKLSSRDLYTGKKITLRESFKYLKEGRIPVEKFINRKVIYNLVRRIAGSKGNETIEPFKFKDGSTITQVLTNAYPSYGKMKSEDLKEVINNAYSGIYTYFDLILDLKSSSKYKPYYDEIFESMKNTPVKNLKDVGSEVRDKVKSKSQIDELDQEVLDQYEEFDQYETDYVTDETDWALFEEFGETGYKKLKERNSANFSVVLDKASNLTIPKLDKYKDIGGETDSEGILIFLSYIDDLSQDITLLSRTASINQGIPNELPKLFKMLKEISDYVVKYHNFPSEYEFLEGRGTMVILDAIFNDPVFNENVLGKAWYPGEGDGERVSYFDIISVLRNAPHTWAMLKSGYKALQIKYNSSALNRITTDILNTDLTVKNDDIPLIQRVANDYYLSFALSKLNSLNKNNFELGLAQFRVRENDLLDITEDLDLDITTIEDRDIFVRWMENVVIPDLKMGYLRNDSGVTSPKNLAIANNYFIRKLVTDQVLDKSLQDVFIYYKLPIDVSRVDPNNMDQQIEVDALKAAFAALDNVYYDGKRLSDLFAMYDFIVQKDKDNSNSIKTLIAANDGNLNKDSFAVNMLRVMGELDYEAFNTGVTQDGYLNPDILSLLAIHGYGKEVKYVPQEVGDYGAPIIKVMQKDEAEGLFRWHYYIAEDDKYELVEGYNSKKIIPVETDIKTSSLNSFQNKAPIMKDRMVQYLRNNINLKIKDC